MAGLKSFKGALSQLYGEQRAQVKGIKERSLVNKAKNEAKRELEEAQSDQPVHFLRIDGRAARLVKNDAQFYAQQQNEGLVPWGAQPDVLIDRYDVRSLLDMYVAPDPRVLAHRQRTAKELELDEQLRFEAYRDLVRLKCLGLSERQGIAHAEQENVAIRAASRAAAVAALEAAKGPKPLPSQSSLFAGSGANAIPAGTGQFAAVGFSYGGSEGGGGGGEDDDDDEEEEESDDDDVPATAEDADMDRSALKEFGLEDFSSMLRWAMREEAEEAAAVRRRKRYTGWGRKKASIRAKRLVGQGLNPTEFAKRPPAHYGGAAALQPNDISWIPERKTEDLAQMFDRRASPEYDGEGGRRRSRSPSSRRPQAEYITSFGGAADQAPGHGQGPRQQQRHEEGPSVRDALPGAADPALEGPHMLPAAAIKLHGVRPEERGRDRYGSISGRDYSKAKSAAAAPKVVKAVDKSKETPQERLKRLMAAQLNKKIQSDTITAAQKKQQEDAERRARMANEAAAQEAERRDRERERARRRSRSRSPRSDRRRSDRSRSRERERERDSRRRSRSRSRSRDRQHRRYWLAGLPGVSEPPGRGSVRGGRVNNQWDWWLTWGARHAARGSRQWPLQRSFGLPAAAVVACLAPARHA